MNTTESPLLVSQICKNFGTQKVLDTIAFSLEKGEIFGLIGLNGVGKTTLIKIILNLLNADSGACKIFGVPSNTVSAHSHLLYLPEKFQPSRYLTGYEYLDLSLSYYKKPFDQNKAKEFALQLDLAPEKLSVRVGSYSKGMGQKLGLLSAFMADVPLLILDEPMSGLDPSARIKLKALLLKSKAEGKTIFFSSHILSDIDEICDRIGVIHARKLQYIGTPQQFKSLNGNVSLEQCFLNAIDAIAA
jgi:ABC-2 type transport system ATP-binding protein